MNKLSLISPALLILCVFAGCNHNDDSASWSVTGITTIKSYGKSVDWLPEDNRIATARLLSDLYYDVMIFSMDDPDTEMYLTHNAAVPQKHNGNPAWHPSGDYIIFTGENEDVTEEYDILAKPGRGINCNLWLAKTDQSGFWQLTSIETAVVDAGGVIHPQFSHDGSRLFWAQRIADDADSYWGHWVIKVADFIDDGTDPRIENITTYDPAAQPGFYESHGFSHDGQKVIFTGNLMEGQHETGMDIYEMDIDTGELNRLTSSFADWDEHAHWSPDGEHIVWMSSTGLDIEWPEDMGPLDWRFYLATELWIMDADGSNKEQLTFYNDPSHAHNKAARTAVSDSAWAPDGKSLIVLVAHYDGTGPSSKATAELVQITLQEN